MLWGTAVHYWAVFASNGGGHAPLKVALSFPDFFDHILARWVCENSLQDPGIGPSGVLSDHSSAIPKPLVHIGDKIFSLSNCPDSHKCFTFLSVRQSLPSLKPAREKKRAKEKKP